jgi:hypothetical protein
MTISCAVFINHISMDSGRGSFDFVAIPAIGESVTLPGIGLNSATTHTVREVIHTPVAVGGNPTVGIIVSMGRS